MSPGNTRIPLRQAMNGSRLKKKGKKIKGTFLLGVILKEIRKTVLKIKSPKSWWKKLTGKTDVYEIFNWTTYEKIVK